MKHIDKEDPKECLTHSLEIIVNYYFKNRIKKESK